MTDRILVGFEGARGGVCGLSWGQTAIWRAIQRLVPDDAVLNMSWVTAIEEEGIARHTPLRRIAETVSFVMGRHESLRTRVRVDDSGEPYQVLARRGQIAVEVVDVAGGIPPAEPAAVEAAAALRERLVAPAFDYGSEWPLRVGAVRSAGFVTHAVFVVCHLVTDRGGLDALVRDVLDGLAGRSDPAQPQTALQPLDQASHQRSEAGRRQSEKALRYWARQLRSVPASRFPAPSSRPQEPRYWNAVLNSPAADKAVSVIAARKQVSSSAVVLAAASFLLARLTRRREAVLQLIVSNRFRPRHGDSVSPMSQDGLCVIAAGHDFDEVVGQAMQASMQAYLHAQYDPAGLDRSLVDLGAQRGTEIDLSCSFNDRRFDSRTAVTPAVDVTETELRAALPATTLIWQAPMERYGARYFLHVNAVPEAIELELFADTEVLPPDDMAAYLWGIESLLVDTASRYLAQATVEPAGTSR